MFTLALKAPNRRLCLRGEKEALGLGALLDAEHKGSEASGTPWGRRRGWVRGPGSEGTAPPVTT